MDILEKYRTHRSLFNSNNETYNGVFEQFLTGCGDAKLECSLKIVEEEIYSDRFNVWFSNRNFNDVLLKIFKFIKELERLDCIKIDAEFLHKYVDHLDLEKIVQLIVGVDFRKQQNESRIKVWFVVNDYMDKIEEILLLHGYNETVLKFITKKELLFGFDFFMDGRILAKIYPCFYLKELTDEKKMKRLEPIFEKRVFDLIQVCEMFYVSFKGTEYDRVIHFFPSKKSTDEFIKRINSNRLLSYLDWISPQLHTEPSIYSFSEKELLRNDIRNFNIYY